MKYNFMDVFDATVVIKNIYEKNVSSTNVSSSCIIQLYYVNNNMIPIENMFF